MRSFTYIFQFSGLALVLLVAAGCSDDSDPGVIIHDSDTEEPMDTGVDQFTLQDAFEDLLATAPQMCLDFCSLVSACEFGNADVTGSSTDISEVMEKFEENCVVDCTYPMIVGTYVFSEDPTTFKRTIKRTMNASEYIDLAACIIGLGANECSSSFDLTFKADIEEECLEMNDCLASLDATCLWQGSCLCKFDESIPEMDFLFGPQN